MVEQGGLASRLGAKDGNDVVGKAGGQQVLGGEVERELGAAGQISPRQERQN